MRAGSSSAINPVVGRLLGFTSYNKLQSSSMSKPPRFQLYVKAGKDGQSLGDCPFSQRANMYCRLKVSDSDIELCPVNVYSKPEFFLKLNPLGKAPVLVDRENSNKVVADSGDITKYLDEQFASPDLHQSYEGPAVEAVSGIFPKFSAMMRNKDSSMDASLKEDLIVELRKLEDYLKSKDSTGTFLVCDQLSELDCQVLPKLKHVQVAGKELKKFEIPAEFTALHDYISCGEAQQAFRATCAPDDEFIYGWQQH